MMPAPTMELTRLDDAPRMEDFFLGRESALSLVVVVVVVDVGGSVSRAEVGRIVGAPPLALLLLALVGDWCC